MPLKLPFALLAGALTLLATPVLADATTYQGTLGKTDIVVELSAPAEAATGTVVGRYFYRAKGIDIPLDAVKASPGKVDLAEEKPCTEKLCPAGDDSSPGGPAPLGAKWHLVATKGGATLTGSWTDGGKSLPIALERTGTRKLPDDFDHTTLSLEDIVPSHLVGGDVRFAMDISPYDYIRMHEGPVAPGDATTWPGGSFQYIVDTRTKFAFPSVTDLNGAALSAIDDALEQRHWQLSADALYCEAEAYQGFGWNVTIADAAGTLAGYEDETVKVHYLSPTVMTLEDSGSIFCGGAHPYNHDEYMNFDVRAGTKLDLSLIFKDWVPTPFDDSDPKDLTSARANPQNYAWNADAALVAFVKDSIPLSGSVTADIDPNSDCGQEHLIDTNLDLAFSEGDKVRFVLDDLGNAVEACGGELYDLAIADLQQFLTPEAVKYFPSLKGK